MPIASVQTRRACRPLLLEIAAGMGLVAWQAHVWMDYPWSRPFPYREHAAWLLAGLLLAGDGLARMPALRTLGRSCLRTRLRRYSVFGAVVAAWALPVGTYVWAEAQVARLASKPIRAASCSRAFLDATVAMEDGRFYRHRGLDFESIHRALRRNIQARRIVQGGSTITQQVAKNLFLGPERTLRRKILEADLALVLERRLTKRQILSMYVRCVDYGLGCRGIEQAARLYFGKRPEELDLAESAVLVGLVPSPPQQFLSAEAINSGRRRALGRIAHYYPDRYTPAALYEAAMRPIEGWVRPYVTAEERDATADLPAVVGEVSFCSYLDPATARPLRHLHPDFARRIRAFVRDARLQLGLRRIVHLGAYVDRFERGSSAKPSSHALGRALDIQAFVFDGGRVIEARPNADPKAAAKLDQVRRLLQKHFPRALWWGNEPVRHHDHFHVELPADEADILAIMERANELRIGAPP